MEKLLHVYSSHAHHDDAFIIGNRDALAALRDAIDSALEGGIAKTDAFICDGEGFSTYVVAVDEQMGNKLSTPYTADYLTQRDGVVYPWQIVAGIVL